MSARTFIVLKYFIIFYPDFECTIQICSYIALRVSSFIFFIFHILTTWSVAWAWVCRSSNFTVRHLSTRTHTERYAHVHDHLCRLPRISSSFISWRVATPQHTPSMILSLRFEQMLVKKIVANDMVTLYSFAFFSREIFNSLLTFNSNLFAHTRNNNCTKRN